MAHLKKNTRGAVPGLAVHFERKTDHHTNKEIDVSKAYLNQDLMADGSDMLSRFNARLNDVYCMKRDDVKALAIWIVTLFAEAPYEQQSAFFEAITAFLNDRYGQENAVAAVVHYDETTPHLHYAFVPVVFDDKKSRYKVSAKEVLTRHDLQTFHEDLNQHLKKVLPFYEHGILNNKTLPFENVAEIKKYNDQFNALKNELADVEENIRAKQAVLKITDRALTEVDLAEKQIDDFKQALSKNLFGKTVLKPDDLDRFKNVLATMKKATLQSQHETEELKQTLGQVKAQLADVQADYQNLKETHQVLQKRQRDQQKLDYAMRDMLKNDYAVDKLSHTDVEARYVLYKLDHEELTQNKKEAQSWLKTLTTARANPDTKIAPTRLDRDIEQVKALILFFI
ncbi:mobilization protein [Enterococcus faecium]|uniref:MobV family relaxase n=1 Tax=Enterococcus faecium TaxID=1352 RepID=UPI00136CEBC2|nr:MobV family relaxase [Enterococcus faecium]EGP5032474.1 mobilization protein [Enterococcus faecium]EGP5068034.1 mobilization protein [Enterococcus faecium]EGP5189749.1 mobilization protein [Enterococcus faecium]EGP5278868.1 mobilization protein [Enterococcus faecium]EKZ0417091.1 plasmid recombination protein [Enterococcus faecium]